MTTTPLDRPAVAVLGAGTMGAGIAVVAARAGHPTHVRDVSPEAVGRGLDNAYAFLDRSASLGKLTPEQAVAARERLTGSTDLADVAGADIVVEAVSEDLALKQRLLGELDDVVGPDTLVHTNTSTLSVTSIAAGSARPGRVVGTHYCNPAQLMTLVEVAEGRHTDPDATRRSIAFLEGLGKTTVVTRDRPGFILNRFLIPWENNCIHALESGLGTVESIDRAVVGALRHPMGPFRLLDVVGLDVHKAVSMRLYEQLRDPRFAPPPLVDRMIDAGDLGRKSGRGFYNYDSTRTFGS